MMLGYRRQASSSVRAEKCSYALLLTILSFHRQRLNMDELYLAFFEVGARD